MSRTGFSGNIFLNCPFDDEYVPIFNALIFTILDCGYFPRCALEIKDSSDNRLKKIVEIIKHCQFGIHDLCRTGLGKNGLPRFNMPFELGLFIGAKHYGVSKQKEKNCLILDSKPYRVQKFLSDIAGHDTDAHSNKIDKAIKLVRNWLNHHDKTTMIPGAKHILSRYNKFQEDRPWLCSKLKLSESDMDFVTYLNLAAYWLNANQNFPIR